MMNNAIRFCIIESEYRLMFAKKTVMLTKMSHILTNNHCMVTSHTENFSVYTGPEVSGLELYRQN